MLGWIAIGLLGLATLLGGRWALRRHDALGRSRPFPVISVVLCLVAAVGCYVPVVRHAQLEHRLTAAARPVAGLTFAVHCETAGEAAVDVGAELGRVRFTADGRPERRAVLTFGVCRQLRSWLRSDRQDPAAVATLPLDQLIAVHVLTHESMHVAGTMDEAVTECRAMARDAAMARSLGASAGYATALAARYRSDVYPRMPDAYRGGTC